jgi:hypothetical protein
MTVDLSRSRAVLIGNARYRQDSEIPDLPGAADCLTAMHALLTSDLCGWPGERVIPLLDVATPGDIARRLTEAIDGVEDVLLVYYVGHGLRTANGQLALTLTDSSGRPGLLPYTSLLYEHLAEIIRCPARTKVVILDCCHAELANRTGFRFQSSLTDTYPVDGLYFIGASKRDQKAKAPEQGGLTCFTAAFIDVVRAGVPGRPPMLLIEDVFQAVRSRLLNDHLPEPVESGTRGARRYPFARNAAPPETHVDHEAENVDLRRRLAEIEQRLGPGAAVIDSATEAGDRAAEPDRAGTPPVVRFTDPRAHRGRIPFARSADVAGPERRLLTNIHAAAALWCAWVLTSGVFIGDRWTGAEIGAVVALALILPVWGYIGAARRDGTVWIVGASIASAGLGVVDLAALVADLWRRYADHTAHGWVPTAVKLLGVLIQILIGYVYRRARRLLPLRDLSRAIQVEERGLAVRYRTGDWRGITPAFLAPLLEVNREYDFVRGFATGVGLLPHAVAAGRMLLLFSDPRRPGTRFPTPDDIGDAVDRLVESDPSSVAWFRARDVDVRLRVFVIGDSGRPEARALSGTRLPRMPLFRYEPDWPPGATVQVMVVSEADLADQLSRTLAGVTAELDLPLLRFLDRLPIPLTPPTRSGATKAARRER